MAEQSQQNKLQKKYHIVDLAREFVKYPVKELPVCLQGLTGNLGQNKVSKSE
jgi:hypothetical protein